MDKSSPRTGRKLQPLRVRPIHSGACHAEDTPPQFKKKKPAIPSLTSLRARAHDIDFVLWRLIFKGVSSDCLRSIDSGDTSNWSVRSIALRLQGYLLQRTVSALHDQQLGGSFSRWSVRAPQSFQPTTVVSIEGPTRVSPPVSKFADRLSVTRW